MDTNQLYNIFNEDFEVEKSNLTASDVIDYANAVFYYDIKDADEEEITSFQDAVNGLEGTGFQVVAIHKYGGTMKKENYEMVANQNKQIGHHSNELKSVLKTNKEIPAWVVAKVNRSATDLSDATHYLDGYKMALGGNIDEYGANEFFNGLNLSAMPESVSDYIKNDILTDKDLELISSNDETFVNVKNLISEKYPKSLEDEEAKATEQEKPSVETPSEESEIIKNYMLQISDLKELIDIEDDANLIAKYDREVSDLQELIDIEKN